MQAPLWAPTIIQVKPRSKEVEETAEHESEKSRLFGLNTEQWVAIFTLVLTVATGLLWWETKRLARGAERAITDLERPYLTASVLAGGIRKWGNEYEIGFSSLTITNQGRSPAILEKVVQRFQLALLPDRVSVGPLGDGNIPNEVLGPGETSNPFPSIPTPERWDDVEGNLWLVGYLIFSDMLGVRYVTGFTLMLGDDGFFRLAHPASQPDYNYTRKLARESDTPLWRKLFSKSHLQPL